MKTLVLLTLVFPLFCSAQVPSAKDPLAAGGCIDRKTLQTFVTANRGQVIFQFDGNMLFNKYAEDTRLSLIRYSVDEKYRTVLVVRDRALNKQNINDASKACVLFFADDRGSIAHPKEGNAPATWWFQDYEEQNAISRCKKIRPTIHAIWSAQLDDFGGQRMSRANVLFTGTAALKGLEEAKRSQREYQEELATRESDNWCASPQYLRNSSLSNDQKLIALLTGKRVEFGLPKIAEEAVLLAIYAPNKIGPESRGWQMYIVQTSGASYRIANGHEFQACENCLSSK